MASHRAIVGARQAYQYQSGRRWNLLLDDGVIVKLPETGWHKQLDALEYLIVDKGILERDFAEIDLQVADAILLRHARSGEQKDKKIERGSAI